MSGFRASEDEFDGPVGGDEDRGGWPDEPSVLESFAVLSSSILQVGGM